jgi:protein TonB
MQTTFYPRHAFKEEGWKTATLPGHRRLTPATPHAGDWHYPGLPKRSWVVWLAALFSAGMHVLLFWGGGPRPAYQPVVMARTETIIQMVMPPLADEEEKPIEELQEEMEQPPGVEVPRLVDLPSSVDLTNVFVQPLDMNVPLQTSVDASKLTSIPLRIAPSGQRGAGMKNLFDLSQLDRRPEPIAQPPPIFPYQLKSTIDSAEVIVEFIVDSHGDPRDVRATASSHGGFELAAVEGVSKWRFRPGMKDGRKVNTRMMVPIRFSVMAAN